MGKFVFIEPILIKAGSDNLRLGQLQQPPKVDCRVLSEDTYQELKKAYDIVCGGDASETGERQLHKQTVTHSALFDASKAILDNIETWLDTGDPADSKTSKVLYDNLKKAIIGFEHCG